MTMNRRAGSWEGPEGGRLFVLAEDVGSAVVVLARIFT